MTFTLPINLVPCCAKCNSEKSNLNEEQYRIYLSAKSNGKARAFKSDILKYQEYVRRWKEFDIPPEWLSKAEITSIILTLDLQDNYNCNKYAKVSKYYQEYQHFQKPVIIDKNGFLLDGFLNVMYAKNHNLKSVPVIQLENVEVIL